MQDSDSITHELQQLRARHAVALNQAADFRNKLENHDAAFRADPVNNEPPDPQEFGQLQAALSAAMSTVSTLEEAIRRRERRLAGMRRLEELQSKLEQAREVMQPLVDERNRLCQELDATVLRMAQQILDIKQQAANFRQVVRGHREVSELLADPNAQLVLDANWAHDTINQMLAFRLGREWPVSDRAQANKEDSCFLVLAGEGRALASQLEHNAARLINQAKADVDA